MPVDHYIARLSADQTTNIAVANHLEFDTDIGTGGLATVSTGAGQANGLFTINITGTYFVRFSNYFSCTNGFIFHELTQHPSNAQLLDATGQPLRTYSDDNRATDGTECATVQSIFELTASDVIKINFIQLSNAVRIYASGTVFEMMRLA